MELPNSLAHESGCVSDLEVYRRHPLLEEQWSAFRAGRASLQASANWYAARLAESSGPVCELACGYGRLLLPAAVAGREVYGTDAVPERIAAARRLFVVQGDLARFEVLRLPAVPHLERCMGGRHFADVVLACNALGYVLTESAKLKLFKGVHAILRPGGRFLFDHGRGSGVLRVLGRWPGLRGSVGTSGHHMRSQLRWDRREHCVRERFVEGIHGDFVAASTDRFRFTTVRRTLALVREAGFELEQACGSFGGEPLRPWSRRLVAVARRV